MSRAVGGSASCFLCLYNTALKMENYAMIRIKKIYKYSLVNTFFNYKILDWLIITLVG